MPVYTLTPAKGGSKISKNDPKNETTGIIFRGPGSVLLNNVTMEEFCRMLQSSAVERPVVDQTGLAGKYDFSLVWTPYNVPVPAPNPAALAPLDKVEPPPDIFTATQQQLGLKLESTRLPVEVMVVDKVREAVG